MPSSIANIKTTNPPSESKPNSSAITKLRKPQEETTNQPTQKHDERGLQEDSLRLAELLDGVICKQGFRKGDAVIVDTGVSGNQRPLPEQDTAFACAVVKLPRWARAEGPVVSDSVAWAPHLDSATKSNQIKSKFWWRYK